MIAVLAWGCDGAGNIALDGGAGDSDAATVLDGAAPDSMVEDASMPTDAGPLVCADLNCDVNASCEDTSGTPTCRCDEGYEGDGTTCTDIDECSDEPEICGAGTCSNAEGGYDCTCPSGYTFDGTTCVDIDECGATPGICGLGTCSNTAGGYDCACPSGYTFDGSTCADVDECVATPGLCGVGSCSNTAGGYACACPSGYTFDGSTCADVNECVATPRICGVGSCSNTAGGYACACPSGYTFDGTTCADVNECVATPGLCGVGSCSNTAGGYTCACPSGYTFDGTTCADVNECVATPRICGVGSCSNTAGGYTCTCPSGSSFNGTTCVASLSGHAVLIGHDLFENQASADRVVGNAVLLANTTGTIRIVRYTQYADNSASGESARTRTAIENTLAAAGRTATFTDLSNYTALDLSTADVLLIPEQENGSDGQLDTVGAAWNGALNAFLDRGGVVIALDFNGSSGGTWRTVNGPGLFSVTGVTSRTGTAMTFAAPTDPLLVGVSAYSGPNGTVSFRGSFTGTTTVVSAGGEPVVVRIQRSRPGQAVLIGHDLFENQASADRVVGNAVLLANTTGTIRIVRYTQYADNSDLGESARTRTAIENTLAAAGRTATFTDLSNYTALDLSTADVLLIPEQENGSDAQLDTVGAAWNGALNAFLDRGGVVIALDFNGSVGGTWRTVNGPRLFSVTGVTSRTGAAMTFAAPSDPLLVGVSAYSGPNGTVSFRGSFTGTTTVVSAGGEPVVLRLQR